MTIQELQAVSQLIGKDETRKVSAAMQQFIEESQRGKSGIYPYHVALSVAVRFGVSIGDATSAVTEHIRRVLAEVTR